MSAAILPPMGGLTAAAGGSGGDDGDEPCKNHLKPTHGVDANPVFSDLDANPDAEANNHPETDPATATTTTTNPPPSAAATQSPTGKKRRKPSTFPDDAPRDCWVCGKLFKSPKAVHGHMRCHPDRGWRGVTPPWQRPGNALMILPGGEAEGKQQGQQFRCRGCARVFGTRQALGGHRASHKNVKGCYAISKDGGGEGSGGGGCVGRKGPVKGQNKKMGGEMRSKKGGRVTTGKGCSLDLNLPPPVDDQDEDPTPGEFDLNAEGSEDGDRQH